MHACRRCVAAGYLACADSVAGFRGRAADRVMVVGQAPGHRSVERGLPFSGPGGAILRGWLVRAGFVPEDFRGRIYITSLTKCDPGPSPRGGGDRKPSPAELELCRPFLLRELELVRPRIILPVGGMAIAAFLGPRRLDDVIGGGVERAGGRLLPLPHPSGVSRWLNDAAHQGLLSRALALLATWRAELDDGDRMGDESAGGADAHPVPPLSARAPRAVASEPDVNGTADACSGEGINPPS